MGSGRDKRRLAAILAADVVGYSRMMEADEAGTLKHLKTARAEVIDPAIAEYGGRMVKTTGDGALVEFPSAVDAVQCAIAIQEEMAEREADRSENERLRFRIGINLGDIIIEGDDIYGDGVNVAARIQELAEPGGVAVSDTAHEMIRGDLEEALEDVGDHTLKNISRPVRVWRWRASDVPILEPPDSRRPSIAVMPLMNMSKDQELEFLADGLTEDIITLLARIPGFLVISRNSTFAYKGRAPDARLIGRELGVRYMVEGSVRPIRDHVRVTIQLIDALDGSHLWASRFNSATTELLEIQDEVTEAIVAHLEPELAHAEVARIERQRVRDHDAWALYQKGASTIARRGWSESSFAEAIDLFRRAIERQPDFALAHARLSLALAVGHLCGYVPDPKEAVDCAERALEIDSGQSEVLGYAGCALGDLRDFERASGLLERAIELNPANAQAWVALGSVCLMSGQTERAIEVLGHGMRISPRDPSLAIWGSVFALALARASRMEDAIAAARTACRHDAKLHNPRVALASILAAAGRTDEAVAALAEARRLRPDLGMREVQGLIGRRAAENLTDVWERAAPAKP